MTGSLKDEDSVPAHTILRIFGVSNVAAIPLAINFITIIFAASDVDSIDLVPVNTIYPELKIVYVNFGSELRNTIPLNFLNHISHI